MFFPSADHLLSLPQHTPGPPPHPPPPHPTPSVLSQTRFSLTFYYSRHSILFSHTPDPFLFLLHYRHLTPSLLLPPTTHTPHLTSPTPLSSLLYLSCCLTHMWLLHLILSHTWFSFFPSLYSLLLQYTLIPLHNPK